MCIGYITQTARGDAETMAPTRPNPAEAEDGQGLLKSDMSAWGASCCVASILVMLCVQTMHFRAHLPCLVFKLDQNASLQTASEYVAEMKEQEEADRRL